MKTAIRPLKLCPDSLPWFRVLGKPVQHLLVGFLSGLHLHLSINSVPDAPAVFDPRKYLDIALNLWKVETIINSFVHPHFPKRSIHQILYLDLLDLLLKYLVLNPKLPEDGW